MNKKPPYYAVIFTSTHSENTQGYQEMAEHMETLAKQQNGFLGMDSARDRVGITISYWDSLDAIKKWKQHGSHLIAQQKGRKDWYSWYDVKICKVEHDYSFGKKDS